MASNYLVKCLTNANGISQQMETTAPKCLWYLDPAAHKIIHKIKNLLCITEIKLYLKRLTFMNKAKP